jgi:hypothetical protein
MNLRDRILVTIRVRVPNPIEPEDDAMCGKLTLSVVAAALLMSPAPLLAGGLPRLCLPVNGVTADNAKACAKRIADATGIKAEKVELLENNKQWYALVSVNCEQVALSELDNALKGSPFSIPRDNLRLFGQVVLEVEIGTAREQQLLSDLKTVKHLTIGDTKRDKGVLFVMVAMPFPPHMGAETADFGKVSFEKELFGAVASDFGPKSDPPATARDLPAYDGLRAIIEKHKGALKGIRWKCLGCHVQGGVAVPNPAGK